MQLPGIRLSVSSFVHPSVCPSKGPQQQTHRCGPRSHLKTARFSDATCHDQVRRIRQSLDSDSLAALICVDVFEHPPPRLASRRPVWSDM